MQDRQAEIRDNDGVVEIMATQKPKQELCNAELKDYFSLPLVRSVIVSYGRDVVAYDGPDGRFGVVGKCERLKGHDGRCKAGKLKYEITVEWWK